MFGLFNWLWSDGGDAPPPRPGGSKLRLEVLERRENPANNYWLGVNDDFTRPENWSEGLPEEGHDLYFVGNLGGPGGPGIPLPPGANGNTSTTFVEGIYFLPPPYGLPSHNFPSKYASIHIVENYAGTLTMPFDIEFGGYTQTCGSTSNPGTNLTVTGTFSWAGGSINTSATAGELRLEGVPSGHIGFATEPIDSGSKIVLKGNAANIGTGASIRGTLTLRNGVGIDVLTGCVLELGDIFGTRSETISTTGTASVLVSTSAALISYGGVLTGLGVLVDGGYLGVQQGGLKATGEASGSVYSVKMTSGAISILNEETLEATNGVKMEDGELRTVGLNNAVVIQSAHIKGAFTMWGGAVKLGTGAYPRYTALKVTKDVKLYGGVFYTTVHGNHNNRFDSIVTLETIECTSSFKLDITAADGPVDPDDTWWGVLYAEGEFVDDEVPGVTDPNTWKTPRLSSDRKSLAVVKK